MCSADIFLGVLAILFPPLPVWVKRGLCSADSLINILLLMLGFIPGLIHSWYIIAKYPEAGYEYETLPQDREHGRVYVYVHDNRPGAQRQQKQPKPQGNMSYGTTGNNSNNNNASSSAGPAPGPAPAANNNNGEGSSEGVTAPPSYAQVVAGDHKVQTQD